MVMQLRMIMLSSALNIGTAHQTTVESGTVWFDRKINKCLSHVKM